jgi:putative acetyltransferase
VRATMDERKPTGPASIGAEAPDQPDVLRLLAESDAYHTALYPSDSLHLLDAAALAAPGVTFIVARIAGAAVGCGAIVRRADGEAEIKRMYVAPRARGRDLGRRILSALEAEARRLRIRRLLLETGTRQPAAIALYRAMGYRDVPPFDGYVDDPLSVFMAKDLGDEHRD